MTSFRCIFLYPPQVVHGGIFHLPSTPCIEMAIINFRSSGGIQKLGVVYRPGFYCHGHAMTELQRRFDRGWLFTLETIDQFISRVVEAKMLASRDRYAARFLYNTSGADYSMRQKLNVRGYEVRAYEEATSRG